MLKNFIVLQSYCNKNMSESTLISYFFSLRNAHIMNTINIGYDRS